MYHFICKKYHKNKFHSAVDSQTDEIKRSIKAYDDHNIILDILFRQIPDIERLF